MVPPTSRLQGEDFLPVVLMLSSDGPSFWDSCVPAVPLNRCSHDWRTKRLGKVEFGSVILQQSPWDPIKARGPIGKQATD